MNETKVISKEEKINGIEGVLDEMFSGHVKLVKAKNGKYFPTWIMEFNEDRLDGVELEPGEIFDADTGETMSISDAYKAVDLDSLYESVMALHMMQERAGELGL